MTLPPPPRDDAPTLAGGRYLMLKRLGSGGQCTVIGAWDTKLRTWRAIKILLPQHADRPKVRRRFAREAIAMKRLEHPNIVRVTDVGDEGAVLPWMAMELVGGGSLADWLEHHDREMPPRMAVLAVSEVLNALEVAHAAGIVHRDVKPQNVLVSPNGVCKLADFGIAQDESARTTAAGAVFGTLGFMAPEQLADSATVDHRADLYAVGALLWALVTRGSTRDLMALAGDAELLARAPEPLRPVLQRALAESRDDRFASASEMRTALALVELPPDQSPPPLALPAMDPTPDDDLTFLEVDPVLERTMGSMGDSLVDARERSVDPGWTTLPSEEGRPPHEDSVPAWAVMDDPATDRRPVRGRFEPSAEPLPAPVPPTGTSLLLTIPLALLGVTGLLALLAVGVFAWSAASVRAASADYDAAKSALEQRLDLESAVLLDLPAAGVDTATIAVDVQAWRESPPGPPRDEAMAVAVTGLLDALPSVAGPPDTPSRLAARQRLSRLQDSTEALAAAHRTWADASGSPLGLVVVTLGLAVGPAAP